MNKSNQKFSIKLSDFLNIGTQTSNDNYILELKSMREIKVNALALLNKL